MLLFFDGFETYGLGDTADARDGLDDVYDQKEEGGLLASDVSVAASNRIPNGQMMQIAIVSSATDANSSAQGPQLPLSAYSQNNEWVFGAAFRAAGGLGDGETFRLFEFLDSDGVRMLSLSGVSSSGDLSLVRHNPTTGSATTVASGGTFSGTDWNFVEVKVKFDSSGGSYEVRLNESAVMSGNGNTSATGATRPSHVRFGHLLNQTIDVDDFYILDTTGAVNNDFLGEIFVQRLRPNGVGDDTDFSSTGTNWQTVEEDAEDGDTSYVESNTAAERDLYHYEDLPQVPDTIFGVIAKPVLRKNDAGSRTYKLLAKSGGTTDQSATRYPASDFVRQAFVFETDPATGALWTQGGVNNAQVGLEIVA